MSTPTSGSLLATKLYLPQTRPQLVTRPRLLTRLQTALLCPLTLISAPAGFGKTTLLSDFRGWLATLASQATQPLTFTWLALDEGDNDPVRFWTYVAAALERICPGVGEAVPLALHSPQPPAIETVLIGLINRLAEQAQELVLVLDDYHVIQSQPIHDALTFLLDHLPPNLHLVLLTRSDPPLPLARLRVRGQLLEIRTTDLRFTPAEAAQFLQQTMHLALTGEQIAQLEGRTEGWIAGLQLAALSMQERGDVAGFLQSFTGSHRYVLDYLIDEVLEQQAQPVQDFLLQTAILDRFSAALCDAVTERRDSRALLQQLERSNLFLIPLDETRTWWRYHHLFADVLRSRRQELPLELGRALHRRAATWFAEHALLAEAIHHALVAPDFGLATQWIEAQAEVMLNRGENRTLQEWLQRMPAALVNTQPRLCLVGAQIAYNRHQMAVAEHYLQMAEAAIPTNDADQLSLHSEVAAVRVGVVLFRRDLPATIALAQQALQDLPADKVRLRSQTTMRMGLAYNWRGDLAQAGQAYREAARLAQLAGDVYTAVLATSNYAGIFYERGELRQAIALEQRAIALATTMDAPHAASIAASQQALASYYYEWNDLAGAARLITAAVEQAQHSGNPRLMLLNYVTLAHVLTAQGDSDGGEENLQRAEQLVQEHNLPVRYTSPVIQARVRRWLAQGELTRAYAWQQNSGLQADDEIAPGQESYYLLLARVLLAAGQHEVALALLVRLGQMAAALARRTHAIHALILQSVVLFQQGDHAQAVATVAQALNLAAPEGFVRSFVDEGEPMKLLLLAFRLALPTRPAHADQLTLLAHLDELLAAFGARPTNKIDQAQALQPKPDVALSKVQGETNQNLIEPLSERELEVLRLLAVGASNQVIAATLIVALNTVKRHVSNIMGKLAVANRTQAVMRARELGLL